VNYEMVDGQVTKVKKVVRKPVEEYFKTQKAVPPPLQAQEAGRRDCGNSGDCRQECRKVRHRYQAEEGIDSFFSLFLAFCRFYFNRTTFASLTE